MAIIYSYQVDTNILSTDYVVGTTTVLINDRPKNTTKSFTMESIANFVISSIPKGNLTANNDVNITLSLGGFPLDSLFNDVSINVGWAGSLADNRIYSAPYWNAKQDPLLGTGIVKSTSGTISYLTDNSSNWNTAYNDKINSASVTGTTTKTLTLNKQDGGTITASWADIGLDLTLTTVGTSGAATLIDSTLNIPNYVTDLTGYVPYTGATSSVDLGIYDLTLGNGMTVGRGGGTYAYNSAFGQWANFSNVTGTQNTAIGWGGLYLNVSGSLNTALGSTALYNNTSGWYNTALGSWALSANITGSYNTGVGVFALYSNVDGSDNTALGRSAGYRLAGGNNNLFLGINAGRFAGAGTDPNTLANDCIYIGSTTKAFAPNQTNEIVIGTNVIGLGSNSTVLGNSNTVKTVIYGNLLLGTTVDNGTNKLQIAGSIKATSDSTIGNVNIGNGGGSVSTNTAVGSSSLINNTVGTQNSAFGFHSLRLNTTGFNNSAFGHLSLSSNNIGDNNSAFGQKSMMLNTGGDNNSAFGHESLANNTIASENSAFGYYSLRYNTTGTQNSAFGSISLVSNNGNGNSAFGYASLNANTIGNQNSAFGKNSLRVSNSSGNSAFGHESLSNNTTDNNSAFGQNSLRDNTSGFANTGIGVSCIRYNQTGSYNVAVGGNAGSFLNDKTTTSTKVDNSIFIGYNASSLGVNQTNQIVIGYNATGLGSNTTVIGNSSTITTGIYGNIRLVSGMGTAPASATATGTLGEIRVTAGYIYVCTATNTWVRAALATW